MDEPIQFVKLHVHDDEKFRAFLIDFGHAHHDNDVFLPLGQPVKILNRNGVEVDVTFTLPTADDLAKLEG